MKYEEDIQRSLSRNVKWISQNGNAQLFLVFFSNSYCIHLFWRGPANFAQELVFDKMLLTLLSNIVECN